MYYVYAILLCSSILGHYKRLIATVTKLDTWCCLPLLIFHCSFVVCLQREVIWKAPKLLDYSILTPSVSPLSYVINWRWSIPHVFRSTVCAAGPSAMFPGHEDFNLLRQEYCLQLDSNLFMSEWVSEFFSFTTLRSMTKFKMCCFAKVSSRYSSVTQMLMLPCI